MRITRTYPKDYVDTKMFDNVQLYNKEIVGEVLPSGTLKCFLGAWYHKVVSSVDNWVGIECVVTLGEFTPDESRFNLDGKGCYMDNHNVYVGGKSGNEADCGLGYNTMYVSSDTSYELKSSSPKLGYRPFYRFIVRERIDDGGNVDVINTNLWRVSDPRDLGNYYFPGDTIRMKLYSPLPNYLQMRIEVVEKTTIQKYVDIRKNYHLENDAPTDYYSPLFYSDGFGIKPSEFKRVSSIDQFGNEGYNAHKTSASVLNEVWRETYLYRMVDGVVVKVPFNESRSLRITCPDSKMCHVTPLNNNLGGEELSLTPKGIK